MQKLQSLLFTILISISIIALAHESMAQNERRAVEGGHPSHHARHIEWSQPESPPSAIVQSADCQRRAVRY